ALPVPRHRPPRLDARGQPRHPILSVSRKDRGAILPVGTVKTHVYWFASNGRFTTSRYYRDTLPTWVARFNARNIPQRYAGQEWTPLLPADRYAEPDTVSFEADGDYTFPHRLTRDTARAGRDIRDWPWMDSLTLAFALEGTRALQLGADANRTDLLAISLSTTDAVGHRYGPDSKEIHDQILRLDRYLGLFLDSLLALRGRDRVLIALTADHGVQPIPELRSAWYPNHDAQRVDPAPAWRVVRAALRRAGVDSNAVDSDDGFRVVDAEAFRRANVDPDAIARLWVAELRTMNGVAAADLITDLARADTTTNVLARRWLHQFAPDGPIRAVVSLEPFAYWKTTTYATHGSPNEADARVPVLFWGSGIAAGRRAGEARVVDMAPTIAQRLGIRPLERLDGVPLTLHP
ncbi:MAG: alkaline phosphatase family protein, partial [Gemmatimonadota bacterium]